jgi:hypothetical protein
VVSKNELVLVKYSLRQHGFIGFHLNDGATTFSVSTLLIFSDMCVFILHVLVLNAVTLYNDTPQKR